MNDIVYYITIGVGFIIPIGVLCLIINVIYRKIKGKSTFTAGTSFVGENIFMNLESQTKKTATEEIQYHRDEKRNDSETGDPPRE